MTFGLVDAVRLARLTALTDRFDGGTLELWSGTRPGTGLPGAGALQATLTLSTPAGSIAGLLYTFGTIGDGLRVGSAAVTWGRFYDSSDVAVADCDVGLLSAPSTPAEEILLTSVSGAISSFVHISTGTIAG